MAVVPDKQANPSAKPARTRMLPFRCDASYVGDRAIVVVRGEVDLDTAPILLRAMLGTLERPIAGVSVDLRDVTFLDSSGVNALNTARQSAQDKGIGFTLDAIPVNVRRVLEVVGMMSVFHIGDDGERIVHGFD